MHRRNRSRSTNDLSFLINNAARTSSSNPFAAPSGPLASPAMAMPIMPMPMQNFSTNPQAMQQMGMSMPQMGMSQMGTAPMGITAPMAQMGTTPMGRSPMEIGMGMGMPMAVSAPPNMGLLVRPSSFTEKSSPESVMEVMS